ncbi:MAG: nucleoside-diphosphate sugar epimerase/dehydratase [Methylophilaceae bacterium]|nr:nucleoside-diphosphate sugar epimerase/dehydratase [Methylophilaceae bacterium]
MPIKKKIKHFSLSGFINLNSWRTNAAWLHDIAAACLAWWLAYLFRFNFDIPASFTTSMLDTALWVVPLQATCFLVFGLYQGVWRFASMPDLKRILKAVVFSAFAIATILLMFPPSTVVPRTILILDPMLLILMMGGSRFIYRAWKEHRLYGSASKLGKPVLVLGAGDAAVSLVKELARSPEWRVVGILDDDRAMHGRQIQGVKVISGLMQLPEVSTSLDVTHVIIAMPSVAHQARRRAVEISNESGLTVLTVPSFEDLMSGKVSISQIRPIEVEDLLGREPVKLDDLGLHDLLENQTVMVTGAGGSIGSELCRQIVRFNPSILICYDLSEFALYQLEQEFSAQAVRTKVVYIVGDIKNEQRLNFILSRYQPSSVFHAAAYKHVPLMENQNVAEALSNNVLGTYILAKACKEASVEKFVMVSTDKAVNPTNVMGASKRLAEMVCQGMQDVSKTDSIGTRFVIVRFGNVLGSSGSVIPKFREQIAKGGPVTVTHPDITRYFMSIPEAAQLVMQAGVMGTGAEVFVMDMGEPVRIADLAKDMIKLSGLQEDEISIEYTGLRPGEKLYEELLADDEHTLPTPHPKLRIAMARSADKAWVKGLVKWIEGALTTDEIQVKEELKLWVVEYQGDVNAESNIGVKPSAVASVSSTIH